MPKRSIRNSILAARRQMPVGDHARLSMSIQQAVLTLPEWCQSSTIALYSPVQNEVDTGVLRQKAFAQGKRVVFPRVTAAGLLFERVLANEKMEPGAFGVLEPNGERVPLEEIELLFVPGVAFDVTGHRLGYGKGYYDQALAATSTETLRVGMAFSQQVVPELPAEKHDVRMDLLITETEVRRFTSPDGGRTKSHLSIQGGIF